MAININTIKGTPRAIGNRVLVSDMHFGDQTTSSGIIIKSDDGKAHGVYARWGKVFDKGPKNKDPYKIGDWILVEHGRWTRGIKFRNQDGEEQTLRKIDPECMLLVSDEDPRMSIQTFNPDELDTGPGVRHRPEDFGAGR